jgi:cyclopropane-fatty-acyl-phospholipid synthase
MLNVPRSSSIERSLLQSILNATGNPPIRLAIKGGASISPTDAQPVGTLLFQDRPALLKMILQPEIGFGDGYADGKIDVEGDLVTLLEAAYNSWPGPAAWGWLTRFKSSWVERFKANSPRRSRTNVHHHYDLTTDFYHRWLDRQLLYTCAYFPTPAATLEEAQTAKMDHVCRKLQLRPDETVAEAGCGWGALALHMAKHYGVRVKAFNLSHEQIVYARQQARQQGLDDKVEFIEDDYRNISGRFDVFASIGMLEHVGIRQYTELGRVIHRTLVKSGRGIVHFIGRNFSAPLSPWITKRIFPGAYAPTLREALTVLEPWDFAVYDVENLRLHYAKTLEHWLDRFERSAPQISSMFDRSFVRAWRLYLAGSLVAFLVGTLQLFQIVFAGPESACTPWTRAHLYEVRQEQGPTWTHAMS